MGSDILQIILQAKDEASRVIQGASGKIDGALSNVVNVAKAAALAAAGVGVAVVGAAGLSIKAASDFESMSVALTTAFQGNRRLADQASQTITQFAARTPYELGEVMRSFIKLKNMGLDPGMSALTAYGDTASAMGKGLNDMVEAVADAATGEFERLKEFGIRASSEGNKVTFTFQGVSTTVGKNAKEIEQYLIGLGQTKFAGGMEAQSKTFSGMMSTLKDTVSIAAAEIANSTGLFAAAKGAIQVASDSIQDLTNKGLALYDLFIKGDFTGRFAKAFNVEEDAELVDTLFTIREGVIALWQQFSQVATAIASYLQPSLAALWTALTTQLLPALQNFWHEIGPVLIPVLQVLGTVLGALLVGSLKLFIDYLTFSVQVTARMADGVIWAKDRIIEAFTWIRDRAFWLKDNFWEVVGFIIGFFATLPIKLPLLVIAAMVNIVSYLATLNWPAILSGIWNAWNTMWVNIFLGAVGLFNRLRAMDWGSIMSGIGRGIANSIIGLIEGAIKGAAAGIPIIGDMAKKLHIPRFDTGGIVPGAIGSPQLVLAHGGETILPTHKQPQSMYGNQTINVYATVSQDIDIDSLGQRLAFSAKQMGRF